MMEVYDVKAKVKELYRQMMNVLERNNAKTEEGYCAMVACLKTVVDNPVLPDHVRRELKNRVVKEMQSELVGPDILLPGTFN